VLIENELWKYNKKFDEFSNDEKDLTVGIATEE
jgi:hypothetical protein